MEEAAAQIAYLIALSFVVLVVWAVRRLNNPRRQLAFVQRQRLRLEASLNDPDLTAEQRVGFKRLLATLKTREAQLSRKLGYPGQLPLHSPMAAAAQPAGAALPQEGRMFEEGMNPSEGRARQYGSASSLFVSKALHEGKTQGGEPGTLEGRLGDLMVVPKPVAPNPPGIGRQGSAANPLRQVLRDPRQRRLLVALHPLLQRRGSPPGPRA